MTAEDEEPADPATMDSDEDDEDYVPGADPDEPRGDDDDENDAGPLGGGADGAEAPRALSVTKQRAVDDAFYDLFGYHYAGALHPASASSGEKSRDKAPAKSSRSVSKRRSILASIFGRNASAKLALHAGRTASFARPKPGSAGGMVRLEKRVVTEIKRFAGQEIKVERVVMVPVMAGEDQVGATAASGAAENGSLSGGAAGNEASSANDQSAAAGAQKAKGVDSLLTELSKPEKLSTISKTSADWDLFKSKNADANLKEQLESKAKGNEAYLVKKDFLNRVDQRKFELEKAERDRERARRGK